MNTALNKVIIALDHMDQEQIDQFIHESKDKVNFYKIGLQTYYKYGNDFLKKLYEKYEIDLFLDLKLHDIPHTIVGAIESLKGLPIKFLTIHLSGGEQMCKAAVEARNKFLPHAKIIGVSLLTSLGQEDFKDLYSYRNETQKNDMMMRLKDIALKAKIDGMVCSAHELDQLQEVMTICPGIRFEDEKSSQDQSRIMSPKKALDAGADYLVIGRSLTRAQNLSARLKELEQINLA